MADTEFKYDVFIYYRHKDEAFQRRLKSIVVPFLKSQER